MNTPLVYRDRHAILLWLALSLLLVASMVLVGGYTRLSGSGLSITEWKPVHGAMPPLNETAWQEEFDAYRASPQYQQVNKGMTLEEFKTIYWPEYFHRLLGRAAGLIFFLPLLLFSMRHSISGRLGFRLLGIFALGAMQGLIGWLMVQSGLVDAPHVSPIRLMLHLITAFMVFALLLWTFLDILNPWAGRTVNNYYKPICWYNLWCTGLFLQIMLGALVAGLHGGLIYNTWPSMNGAWIPPELSNLNRNPFLDPAGVQFIHRNLAVLLSISFLFWWSFYRRYVRDKRLGKVCAGVTAVIAVQFALGVLTLLHHVPLPLALAHQMTALLLVTSALVLLHGLVTTTNT